MTSLAELRRATDPRMQDLRYIARRVFVDRNASGMPARDRAAIKAAARPHLRLAIRVTREARDRLLDGDDGLAELLRDRARMHLAHAALEMYAPFANRLGLQWDARREHAQRATAARRADAELIEVIRGILARGERIRTKKLAADFGVDVRTVQRYAREARGQKRQSL